MRRRASTILEIILYFSVLAILLTVALTFSIQILNITSLSSNIHDIHGNLDYISHKIEYTIQRAASVDDAGSTFDNDIGVLSLNMSDVLISPSVFTLYEGDLYFSEGGSEAVVLNSEYVIFDSLRFHKVSFDKAPDQIIIDAVLRPKNEDIANLQQTIPFHISVSLR